MVYVIVASGGMNPWFPYPTVIFPFGSLERPTGMVAVAARNEGCSGMMQAPLSVPRQRDELACGGGGSIIVRPSEHDSPGPHAIVSPSRKIPNSGAPTPTSSKNASSYAV